MHSRALYGLLCAGLLLAACGGSDPNRTPAALVAISGGNQTGRAGLALPSPLVVQVDDKEGDPVANVAVGFTVTAGGGSVQPASVVTNERGQASASWALGTTAGAPSTTTASVAGLAGSPVQFIATVEAAPPATVTVLQGDHQVAEVGQALPLPLIVEFRDAFGNPVSNQPATLATTTGGGSVMPATSLTDAQGRVSAAWTLGYAAGADAQQLQVQAGALPATLKATGTLTTGTLAILSGSGQLGLGGQPLALPLTTVVMAADSHPVSGVRIGWSAAAGSGIVAPDTSVTDAQGRASAIWSLGSLPGAQTASATNPALTPTAVHFHGTAIVPQPSSITGTVAVSDSLFQAPPANRGLRGAMRLSAEPAGAGLRRHDTPSADIPGELLLTLAPQAINAPSPRFLRAAPAAAQVAASMRGVLAPHLAGGAVRLSGLAPVIRLARIRVSAGADVDSVMRALGGDPAVLSVARSPLVRADRAPPAGPVRPGNVPNDPNYPNQSWHYAMIDLPRAWSITTGSASVVVAVLDNGIVFHHPGIGIAGGSYLAAGGNLRNDGYDFVSAGVFADSICAGGSSDNAGDGDGYDPDPSIPDDRITAPSCLGPRDSLGGHGLHVAGTIGAIGNDGLSTTGVNWQVGIRPVRVLGLDGGDYFDIANGVLYAEGFPVDDGHGGFIQLPSGAPPARIINLSLGGRCLQGADPLHTAISAVTDPTLPNGGALVVASAGNDNTSIAPCPAAYPEVLAVAAVGPAGTRASYSNFGAWVGIAAPGGETSAPDATYWVYSTVCNFAVTPAPCTPREARLPGTSMAAPHVSGVAALLLAQNPGLSAQTLRSMLTGFATPVSASQQIGAGIVNARNALTQTTAPSHQLYVRAVDALSGATVATAPAVGGNYTLSGLPDGSYYVVAGEDEATDGLIGLPGRRFGVFGGNAAPTPVLVSTAQGGFASFVVGYPGEREPNDLPAGATRLLLDGAVQGELTAAGDNVDYFRVSIPAAGTYSFETTGGQGAFCSFALDLNTTLTLYDSAQAQLAQNADIDLAHNNFCSRITQSLSAGTYYLAVTRGDFFGFGPHSGRYILAARTGP